MRYQFLLAENLSDTVIAAFPELDMAPGPVGGTSLCGQFSDWSALFGIIERLDDLGLRVVEMRQLPESTRRD